LGGELTKSSGTLAALRIMESCSNTIRLTTQLRNSDVVAEPPAAVTAATETVKN